MMEKNWEAAEDRIYAIAASLNDRPHAEHLVEDARSKTSPLNPFFEWDNKRAGETARLVTARQLLRRIKFEVTVKKETIAAPAFFRDPDMEYHDQGYVAHPVVDGDKRIKKLVCAHEFKNAAAVLGRAIISAKSLRINCTKAEKAKTMIEEVASAIEKS